MATLNLSVTIPDDKVVSAIDALAYQNGWTEFIEDDYGVQVENPLTKQQWIRRWILGVVKASYKAYNDKVAVSDAIDNQAEDGSDFT